VAIRVSNDYDLNGFKIINLADPTMPSHAATRSYARVKTTVWGLRPPRKQQQHAQDTQTPLPGLQLSG